MAAAPASAESAGDRWRYVGVDAFISSKKYETVVEVLGSAGAGVIESTRDEAGQSKEWVYTKAPTLVGSTGPMVVFSPLVGMAQSLQVGQTWRGIAMERLGACIDGRCSAEAKVEAVEKITTTAGTFDAYRVEIVIIGTNNIYASSRGDLKYWYAPQVKRIVKYTARSRGFIPMFTDMESQLAAYQLSGQAAVGTLKQQ